MRYYDLNENGWPLDAFARPQPGKDLHHLPDRPGENHRWDGAEWVEDSAKVEAECLTAIDAKASEVRDRFITSGTGQSAVYLTKYEEARAYQSDSSPDETKYPYIYAEAKRRGMTESDLVDQVIATRNAWTDPPGAKIEAERVGGKDDVREAESADDKRTACDAAIATIEAIEP